MNLNTDLSAEDLSVFSPASKDKYAHKGCSVEGCARPRTPGSGCGRGMCATHYRQFLRTGGIDHKLPRFREALAEAGLALAAAPEDREVWWLLAEAAVNLGGAEFFRAPRWGAIRDGVRAALDGESFGALRGAALMYAEHPTDEDADATFVVAREAFHGAARAFARPFNLDVIRRAA